MSSRPERVIEGTPDLVRDEVTFKITHEALAWLIDRFNAGGVTAEDGRRLELAYQPYDKDMCDLVVYSHDPS